MEADSRQPEGRASAQANHKSAHKAQKPRPGTRAVAENTEWRQPEGPTNAQANNKLAGKRPRSAQKAAALDVDRRQYEGQTNAQASHKSAVPVQKPRSALKATAPVQSAQRPRASLPASVDIAQPAQTRCATGLEVHCHTQGVFCCSDCLRLRLGELSKTTGLCSRMLCAASQGRVYSALREAAEQPRMPHQPDLQHQAMEYTGGVSLLTNVHVQAGCNGCPGHAP